MVAKMEGRHRSQGWASGLTGMALGPSPTVILAQEGDQPATAKAYSVRGVLENSVLLCEALAPYTLV